MEHKPLLPSPIILQCLLLSVWCIACTGSHTTPDNPGGHHEDIRETIARMEKDSVTDRLNTVSIMEDIKKVLAEVPTENGEFYVLARECMITSHPCSNCHNQPLSQLQKPKKDSVKRAHWEVSLDHANGLAMDCATCHHTVNMDKLTSLTGKMISYDQSHKTCAQCHNTQYKDWLGGAHGKRATGWGNLRVANTCTNCHNPHKPQIKSRWPSRLNTYKLKAQEGE